MNVLLDPITAQTFDQLGALANLLRYQRNPILLLHHGNIKEDFKTFPLVIDAGFYVLDPFNLDQLWSLFKVDPLSDKIRFDIIDWKNQSYKLG